MNLLHGDCLEVLRTLPDNSVDAVVTDPPYGLSFMGKRWDYDVPATEVWAECLRVLKPGGHLLAFAGTRTQHRMAVRIEDAGFEIRDMIAWVYGSGFPKSLDVSKAIDKVRDWSKVERLNTEIKRARKASGLSLKQIGEAMQAATKNQYGAWYHRGGHMFFETGRSFPSRPEWEHLRRVLPIAPEFQDAYDQAERDVLATEVRYNAASGIVSAGRDERTLIARKITAPATDAARQWQGWGTALKPALEPITVARKPLAGTLAENVLAHGTGAINVDGCRVEPTGESRERVGEESQDRRYTEAGSTNFAATPGVRGGDPAGRWPANLIHDGSEEVTEQFPVANDNSAARFFYCAKASKRDRDEGLEGFDVIIHSSQSNESGLWDQEESLARLLVAMDNSRLKVIAASGALSKSATEWNTLLFGSASTALSHQSTMYTTETATSSTTESRILSCFQNLLTNESIAVVNFGMVFGGSRVESVETGSQQITITSAMTASVRGVENVPSKTRLRISVSARRNNHVTVKPTDLMRYLCRLVTPPGGVVLDPFMGSGSTGKAAMLEGFRFIGIEREAEYLEIARARILAATPEPANDNEPQPDLFGQTA